MLNDTEGLGGGTAERGRRPDGTFARSVTAQFHGYVDKRKTDAARAISDVAAAIRDSGSELGESPHLKAFFDNAAAGVDELADSVAQRTFGEIYDEVDAAARRHPAAAFAAAALAGFALFRLVRASRIRPIPRSHALVPSASMPVPDASAAERAG